MTKIYIECNSKFRQEKVYAIQTVINDLIGCECEIDFNDQCYNYTLVYEDKKIVFEDHFFLNINSNNYINSENIPKDISYLNFDRIINLPIIFGNNRVSYFNNELNCGFDIFASAFFMLTRWEEEVITNKNKEGRVCEYELLSVRHGFYNRPIVNEYVDLLLTFLKKIGVPINQSSKKFDIKITHDVDWIQLSNQKELFKNLYIKIKKKKEIRNALKIFRQYYKYKFSNKNPFNSFPDLIKLYNGLNVKASFYFKAVKKGEGGFTYDIESEFARSIIKSLELNQHEIGFHPSENTVYNDSQFNLELKRLKSVVNTTVSGGRNHGLFYNNHTFEQWQSDELIYDSGLGFQYFNGFRCGICTPFKLFDIKERKVLNLLELPFMIMDTVFLRNKVIPEEAYREMIEIVETVKKHKGTLCFNWHSNLVNAENLKEYRETFINVIKYMVYEKTLD
ncbi:MAG: hypothetical protein JXP36_20425 [Bacteroidales bacterium]|nr:hypothetical protein [Bacteroidales bacterium]